MTGATYANDIWCLDDGFGPTRLGDEVARVALQAQTPFAIGVVGKWGSGKTSVLRRAFATLGGRPIAQAVPLGDDRRELSADLSAQWEQWSHAARSDQLGWRGAGAAGERDLHAVASDSLCVWFSPWQHQRAPNPLVPLLLEIREQYTVWQRIKDKAGKLNRQGGLAALALVEKVIDAAASLKLGRPARLAEGTTDAVRKAWREGAPDLDLSDGQRFHLAFEDAVEMLLGGKDDARLVVFVDDLDRCEENTIVELLEAIKLYLASRRCVFVLGVDDAAVHDALKRHWKGRPDDANREYLEKLFQATLPVPPPRPDGVAAWAEQACRAHGLPDDATLGAHVAELIEANPRKVKNFVNSLGALWAALRSSPAAGAAERTLFARRFLLFHYLRTQHRDVWRLLEREPWTLALLARVLGRADPGEGLVQLPDGVRLDDQRLVEAVFFRAFAHVLADPTVAGTPEDALKRHGHLPIGEAVDLMLQRIDRKRSDERFKQLFRRWVIDEPLSALPPEFIHLPEPPA